MSFGGATLLSKLYGGTLVVVVGAGLVAGTVDASAEARVVGDALFVPLPPLHAAAVATARTTTPHRTALPTGRNAKPLTRATQWLRLPHVAGSSSCLARISASAWMRS